MDLKIIGIPAFSDNYIWLLIDASKKTVVCVDPGDAEPVLRTLSEMKLTLSAILLTHHHFDHSGGVSELVKKFSVPVFGSKDSRVSEVDNRLAQGDSITLPGIDLNLSVLEIPGHTLDHIAFYTPDVTPGLLFCGDTLFAAGCGRVFEGSFPQMYESLMKLKALPADTKVYCAHEYTVQNLRFAQTVEPNNHKIKERLRTAQAQRAMDHITLPSLMRLESETNPFLRCDIESVQKAASEKAGKVMKNEVEVFTLVRQWKDKF